MYETITYEEILKRMLDRIPSNMDKREGSIIYDALAPAAIELQLMYIELDIILSETFGDTASREYLILRAAERGIVPYPATNAILKAVTTPTSVNLPTGSRFSLNELSYMVTEKITDGEYKLQCEHTGVVGNSYFGSLIPINYIQGLETITITELLIPGEEEEETEEIRKRYFETFDTKSYGGNKKDYIQKTNAIPGVGSTKVTPIWNGGGTVLLTILDSGYNKASSDLIQSVQDTMDPTGDGAGVGVAPIGHIVTVRTVDEVPIHITTTITFQPGFSFTSQKTVIEKVVSDYLLEIRKTWADTENSEVIISQINARILNTEGVVDVDGTTINSSTSNLLLDVYEIPILGGVVNA